MSITFIAFKPPKITDVKVIMHQSFTTSLPAMNLFLLAVTCILLFIFLSKRWYKPSNFPPGPPWLPVVGNQLYVKKLVKARRGLHHAFFEIARTCNSKILGLKLGPQYVVALLSYPLVREMMLNADFESRPDNFFMRLRSFGRAKSGITGSDGKVWSSNRTFVVRHFRSLGFGKHPMEVLIKTEVRDVIEFLHSDGANIKISKFFAPKVLNILWTLVGGERTENGDTVLEELLDLFAIRAKIFDASGGVLNQYPWVRFLAPNWSGYNLIQEINFKLKKLVLGMIERHQETWHEGRNDDLIYAYISEMQKTQQSIFCVEELIAVCFDLFIAGTQTTSGTLEILLFMMTLHPDVQKRVQAEIDAHIAHDELTYSDVDKLPYTEAVLMEALRHSPILPIIGPRCAIRDTRLGGYSIPKGTTILCDFFSMNRDTEIWPDPEEFRPERFLDVANPQGYIPFGIGKRRCPGDVLAKQGLFYFFVEIMRKFDVVLAPDCEVTEGAISGGITLVPENYRARFVPRVI